MKNITQFPQKFKEIFQHQGEINLRTWHKELRFKQSIKERLGKVIDSVHSLDQWYRSINIDAYASEIQLCVERLDEYRIYYRNSFYADIIRREIVQDELKRKINLKEYQKQHHPGEDVLQDMYDMDIYLAQKSLKTLEPSPSDWVIRRVDKDGYNHQNVYYQGMDGALIAHFGYRLINAIDNDTEVKADIFDVKTTIEEE